MVVELQSQLVHVNLAFATEIADIQESVAKELNRLVDTIAENLKYELKPTDFVEVSMIPPVVLMLQLIEMTAGSAKLPMFIEKKIIRHTLITISLCRVHNNENIVLTMSLG